MLFPETLGSCEGIWVQLSQLTTKIYTGSSMAYHVTNIYFWIAISQSREL